MSRTKKGSKGPGYEFWSRRPRSNRSGCSPGKISKTLTHRAERAAERAMLCKLKELGPCR